MNIANGSDNLATGYKTRESNFELLRVVSMVMVLLVHIDGASLGLPQANGDIGAVTAREWWQLAVESAAIIGVNCFTMISGYFGIRLRWRSVASFLFECIFYAVGIYSLCFAMWPGRLSWTGWLESWLVLSHTDLWYVPAYFGLMLLSPLLNAGAESMSRRAFATVLAAFSAFTVWCGWWWGARFNPTGYTLLQLVWVYLIARYARMYISMEYLRERRRFIVAAYLLSVAAVLITSLYMEPIKAFAYNSPAVMCATVSLFFLTATMRFRSRSINFLARSAFAVYLIHKAPLIWGNVMRPAVIWLWKSQGLAGFSLCAAGIVAGFYLVAVVADAVRRAAWQAVSKKLPGLAA